ncbi:Cache 3/Cache 2 fusion domain-containing protein [Dyella acidiphila]|uniref:histidine kinase n=1 Tax=Dyella acidiphila TaxID=2775866 RepID=A0ABR9GER4_9GAMM|nr:Cache 3/Cache 2 fusion domain-containing protein [Dyella acidiphila]MBE1162541.1 Cache 3/Cache 2 fusion domain-containing protein [Dyella acidiphila]
MFGNSLRARLLLPVLALGLAAVIATAITLAYVEAARVRNEARASIDGQVSALQSLLDVTHSIMLDRVRSSMLLLRQEGDEQGVASAGQPVTVAGRQANDLLLGGKSQANVFQLVDSVTAVMGGTATLFTKTGDDYVRISTNVKKADGTRAVGTMLDPKGPVIGEIRQGRSFYGVVDILGNPYVTGYEPIYDHGDPRPIGIWYVGYKTDLDVLNKVISNSRVLGSGFIALLDSKDVPRFHSNTAAAADASFISKIIQQQPTDWTVEKYNVPNWGFTLVAAYPNSDIDQLIVQQTVWIGLVGLLMCVLVLGVQYLLIQNRVLRPIQNLTQVADALSMGKFDNVIAEVALKDEIGTLAKAIARLSNSVRLAMDRLSKR